MDKSKNTAACEHIKWLMTLPSSDVVVYTDGSELFDEEMKYVGYSFAVYLAGVEVANGTASLNNLSHIFNAEALDAL